MVCRAVLVLELVRAVILAPLLAPLVVPLVLPVVLPERVLVVLSVRPPTYLFK